MDTIESHVNRVSKGRDDATEKNSFYTALRGMHETALMLSIALKTGKHRSLPYMYLSKIEFDPSNEIQMEIAGQLVTITGWNLKELYRLLRKHKIEEIRAADTDIGVEDDGKPFISSIDVIEMGLVE